MMSLWSIGHTVTIHFSLSWDQQLILRSGSFSASCLFVPVEAFVLLFWLCPAKRLCHSVISQWLWCCLEQWLKEHGEHFFHHRTDLRWRMKELMVQGDKGPVSLYIHSNTKAHIFNACLILRRTFLQCDTILLHTSRGDTVQCLSDI